MILNCPSCAASFKADPALLGTSGRSVRCGSCGHSWHQMPPDEDPTSELEIEKVVEERHELETEGILEQQDSLEIEDVIEETDEPEIADVIEEDGELDIGDVFEQGDEIEIAAEFEEQDDVEEAPRIQVKTVERKDPTLDKLDEQRERVQARSSVVTSERRPPSRAMGWIALLLLVTVLAGTLWAGKSQIMAWAPGTARFYEMVGLHGGIGQGLDLRDVVSERRIVDGERRLVVEGTIVNISGNPLQVPQIRASLTDGAGTELSQWTFTADSETLPPGGFTTFQTSTANPPDEGNLSLAFTEGD